MKDYQEVINTDITNDLISHEIYDWEPVRYITECATCITDENYHKVEFEKVAYACTCLDKEECNKLYLLLKKYEIIFDVTLGIKNTHPIDILLEEDVTPYHSRPFPAPRAYKKSLRKKLNDYVNLELYTTVMIQNGEPHVSSKLRKIILFNS